MNELNLGRHRNQLRDFKSHRNIKIIRKIIRIRLDACTWFATRPIAASQFQLLKTLVNFTPVVTEIVTMFDYRMEEFEAGYAPNAALADIASGIIDARNVFREALILMMKELLEPILGPAKAYR